VGCIQEQESGEEGLESQVVGQFDAAEVVIPWAEESSNSRSSLPEVSGCWLDRGSIDGIALRDDVRNAATAVWPIACDKTRAATGDSTETAELMEVAVMQASQYLDRLKPEASVEPPSALLVTIFNRLLWRRAALLARLQPAGDDIELKASVQSWEDEVNTGLLFKRNQAAKRRRKGWKNRGIRFSRATLPGTFRKTWTLEKRSCCWHGTAMWKRIIPIQTALAVLALKY